MVFEEAVQALYQAPLGEFVAERKRLAGELKAGGDKAGATRLAACKRPTVSAWAVDQLYWHARDAFDAMLATAARLRKGELAARGAHQAAIAALRQRAAAMLGAAGHGASEAVLRRIATTLAAIAAAGGFAPDPPGALAEDRDPPGFEAMPDVLEVPAPVAAPKPVAHARGEPLPPPPPPRDEAAERRAQREHARERIAAALRTARGEVASRERAATRLAAELRAAEAAVDTARQQAAALEHQLAELEDEP